MKDFHKSLGIFGGDTAAFQKAVADLSRERDHGPAARLPGCRGPVFLQMITISMEKVIAEFEGDIAQLIRDRDG